MAWHTSRGLLRCSLGIEATGGHPCDLLRLRSRSKVSLGKELMLFLWCPHFCGCQAGLTSRLPGSGGALCL